MIVINFKNYKFGRESLGLAKIIQKYLGNSVVSVPASDIGPISEKTRLKVYAQHVDSSERGRATGFILPEAVKKSGASGSLLNHSEHQVPLKQIKETLKTAEKHNLKIILCSASLSETKKFLKLNPKPFAIAFEDPNLVGSGRSITEYKSKEVSKFSSLLKGRNVIPLCGAGINSEEDVREARNLGCKGVLIASAVAKSRNPSNLLRKLSKIK